MIKKRARDVKAPVAPLELGMMTIRFILTSDINTEYSIRLSKTATSGDLAKFLQETYGNDISHLKISDYSNFQVHDSIYTSYSPVVPLRDYSLLLVELNFLESVNVRHLVHDLNSFVDLTPLYEAMFPDKSNTSKVESSFQEDSAERSKPSFIYCPPETTEEDTLSDKMSSQSKPTAVDNDMQQYKYRDSPSKYRSRIPGSLEFRRLLPDVMAQKERLSSSEPAEVSINKEATTEKGCDLRKATELMASAPAPDSEKPPVFDM